MIHNLRSALDHLVWQLVLLNGEKPRRQNQFPVIGARKEYWEAKPNRSESVRDRLLLGVAEEHRAFIDMVQPFNAGENPETALVHLSWFSNRDKHRVVHGSFVLTEKPSMDLFDLTTTHPGGALVHLSGYAGDLEDGAEVFRFRPVPADAHVNVNAQFPTYIAFGDAEKPFSQDAIKVIFDWVNAYIRGFEPIFRGELAMGKRSPIKFAPASKAS